MPSEILLSVGLSEASAKCLAIDELEDVQYGVRRIAVQANLATLHKYGSTEPTVNL